MEALLSGLRAVAEPTRLRILALCAHAELSVTELVSILGQSQPRVSRHLKLMVEAGVLERNREGARAFYRPAERGELADMVQSLVALVPAEDPAVLDDLVRLDGIREERAERASRYFQANAARWEELRGLYIDDAVVDGRLLAALREEPGGDLLDIGTGTGRVLEMAADHVSSAVGIDNARPMLEIARANLDKAGYRHCQVRLADMYRLPFPAERFDAVTINMVLHYAESPGALLAEVARVLKPGGRLIVVDFASHELVELRDEHEHRWLGFAEAEVARIATHAGLTLEPTVAVEGEPLTVCLWQARRAPAARIAAAS